MFNFFSCQSPHKQGLSKVAGGEHEPSAAGSYGPDNLLSSWLMESDSHISVIFTWLVLFPKMQPFFSYLETELFLAWGFSYLTGRNILIDFLVPFGSLISICLIDVFPCFWSFFFFYPSYEHLKWFVNSIYLFLCDLLEFMTGRTGAN